MRVSGNVKFAAVSGNKGIPAHKALRGEAEIKLPEDVVESFRKELCTLLDEGRSRRDILGQEIKIFEQFMADASASHAEEEMDQLYKPQLPAACKILSGVVDKPGGIAGHGVHDCPERRLDLLWE